MLVQGKLNTYNCQFEACGWSGAKAVLYVTVQKSLLRGLIKFKWSKKVWSSFGPNTLSFSFEEVRKARPQQLRNWCQQIVDEYEQYVLEWAAENKTKTIVH